MDTLQISRVSETQWQALDRDLVIGHGDAAHRPDGRLFVSIDVWEDAAFEPLATAMMAALPTPLHTVVGEADDELKARWERAGFTTARRESEYDVPTGPLSLPTARDVTILPAGTADERLLRQLDSAIRAEVEASVGWATMPAEVHPRPAGDTIVDSSRYAVAVRDGRYVGLVRLVAFRGRARIGLIAVRADSQRAGVGRALLHHALDAIHRDGIESAWAEVDESNTPAVALFTGAGARRSGGCLELVRA